MRVVRVYDYLDVRIEETEPPGIGPGEALVRGLLCGICSGDVVPWYIRRKAPLVLGHEPVGEIVEVGPGVREFRAGDRVFAHHHAPCGRCRACSRGAFVQCAAWRRSRLDPGGMAEYYRVPALNLAADTLRIPDSVSDEDAVLTEPLACVVKSLRRAGPIEGATVLVIGLGVMGQMHVLLAREWGAAKVIAADLEPVRCAFAAGLGADVVLQVGPDAPLPELVREVTAGEGADVVIAGPASVEALEAGFSSVARGGTIVQFMGTPPGERLSLDTHEAYFREIRLVPSYSAGPDDTRLALKCIERGVVTASRIVTHWFDMRDAAMAYRTAAEDRRCIKAVVRLARSKQET